MKSKVLISALLVSAVSIPVLAQNAPNSAQDRPAVAVPAATTTAPAAKVTGWRASKLIGVDVYNENNENLGEINEVLIDQSGKVTGVLIGVGGFLGMGQRDVLVTLDKLKFVNEPRSATMASGTTAPRRADTTTTTTTTGAATTTSNNTAATRPARAATERWYPDHAILVGATKDTLKNMTEFKYD